MIKYSVIVPTYNSSQTIEKCLDSILNQFDENIEVVVIDDHSKDNTCDIVSSYGHKVKLIRKTKNEGPSIARNIGIASCRGDYIVFIDSDDYIEADYFANVNDALNGKNIDLLKINTNYYGNRIDSKLFNTSSTDILNGESLLLKLLGENKIFSTPWMYIIKRSLFLENNLFFSNDRIHEDLGLIPCLILKAKRTMAIDYVGYNYIYHDGSLSTSKNYEQVVRRARDIIYQYDFLIDYFNKNTNNELLKQALKDYLKQSLVSKKNNLLMPELEQYEKKLKKRGIF